MFALDLVKNSNKINGALFTNYHLLHTLQGNGIREIGVLSVRLRKRKL